MLIRTHTGASAPTAWALWTDRPLSSGADARHANTAAMLRRGGNHEALDTASTHRCCDTGGSVIGRRARDVPGPHRNPTARLALWQLYRSRQRCAHAYH